MGLDMYLQTVAVKDAVSDFEYTHSNDVGEVAYWRKNHDLHRYMEALYWKKMDRPIGNLTRDERFEFNCVPLRLTDTDIHELMGTLLTGLGLVEDSALKEDLRFFKKALSEIKRGRAIYYYSWW